MSHTNHKVSCSEKMSWLFPENLCIPMSIFSYPVDAFSKWVLHFINLWQHIFSLSKFCYEFLLSVYFSITWSRDYPLFMHIMFITAAMINNNLDVWHLNPLLLALSSEPLHRKCPRVLAQLPSLHSPSLPLLFMFSTYPCVSCMFWGRIWMRSHVFIN